MIFLYFFISIFISLFILYSTARHDFVLLRQNISLRQMFDSAFILILVAFFVGRLFFALDSGQYDILHPLKFLYIAKYWGIVLSISYLGGFASLYFLFRKKKNIFRIFDIYFISFYPLLVLDIILKEQGGLLLPVKIGFLTIAALLFVWFLRIHKNFLVKDGFLAFCILFFSAFVTGVFSIGASGLFTFPHIFLQIISIATCIASLVFMVGISRNLINKS